MKYTESEYHQQNDDNTIIPKDRLKLREEVRTQDVDTTGLEAAGDPDLGMKKIHDAWFFNVSVEHFKMPIGLWPKG